MRAKAHKFEGFGIWLAINQHEIRPEVAISMVCPFPRQLVVNISERQRFIRKQQIDDFRQQRIEPFAKNP